MADVFEGRAELDAPRRRLWEVIRVTPWLDWLLLTKRPENIGRMAPWTATWPANVWIGTSVENQEWAKKRLPLLLQHPAKRRFLSCEPLLGPLDLSSWTVKRPSELHPIDWIIAGGESGPNARPMLPGWARTLRDQCQQSGIPFHFKQWGHWAPVAGRRNRNTQTVLSFWDDVAGEEVYMEAKGKKQAGRRLDGTTWDEIPKAA